MRNQEHGVVVELGVVDEVEVSQKPVRDVIAATSRGSHSTHKGDVDEVSIANSKIKIERGKARQTLPKKN